MNNVSSCLRKIPLLPILGKHSCISHLCCSLHKKIPQPAKKQSVVIKNTTVSRVVKKSQPIIQCKIKEQKRTPFIIKIDLQKKDTSLELLIQKEIQYARLLFQHETKITKESILPLRLKIAAFDVEERIKELPPSFFA